MPLRVLLVEDSEDDAKLALHALRKGGFDPKWLRVQTAADLEAALARQAWDAVISDFRMPGFSGLDALGIVRATGLDIPFILISGTIGEAIAVDAMKAGASDYIMKKSLARLVPALQGELAATRARAAHLRDQKALGESEERFRQLAENIRDVFFLIDANGERMLYISPAYEEIWGRTCESAYADPKSWTEAIHPDDRASARESSRRGVLAGKYELAYRIVRPDGSIRWIEARGYPVHDADGRIVRIAGVAEDITQSKRAAEELRHSESLKGAILEASLDCVVTIDHDGRIVEFNPASVDAFGFSREHALGERMVDLIVPPRLREAHRRGFANYLATGAGRILGRRLETEGVRADGTEFPIELAITALAGTPRPMFTAFIRDVTARRESDAKIKRLNRVHAVSSGINSLSVRVGDRDALFREACQVALDKGGFRMAWIGIVDRSIGKVVPIAVAGHDEELLEAIKGRISSDESGTLGSNIAARAIATRKAAVSNDLQTDPQVALRSLHLESGIRSMAMLPLIVANEPIGVLALYSEETGFFDDQELRLLTQLAGDIAFAMDHIEQQERLDYLALYDALTRLANRALFLERVAQYMRSAAGTGDKLAVLYIDLEGFKNINDSLGQPAGDELLRQVAEWLTRNVGDASLLARVGADHFAVVLPELKQEESVTRVVERMMETFSEHPFRLNDAVFRVAARVGIALFPEGGTDADALFRNAEAALKKAKASGDRCLVFTRNMTDMVAGRLTMENQLREALEGGQFVLHYQPKVSLSTGRLTGAEALIRWNDPRTGLVPPAQFIPILEQTGLIHEVGRWALRKAIEDYLRWRRAGLDAVRIAVNVSPMQLRSRGFIAELEHEIAIHRDAAGGLELELTENLIMADVRHGIASLEAIRAMGLTVAIDDFGTGFSSLSYLARLPVDTLKIDRSFVVDMTVSPQGLALVSTIINLAHSLQLKVVAEGVETEEQSRLLKMRGCDEMQGYLLSRPVPADVFEARFLALPAAA